MTLRARPLTSASSCAVSRAAAASAAASLVAATATAPHTGATTTTTTVITASASSSQQSCWFTRSEPRNRTSNITLVQISLRMVEVKGSDLVATGADGLTAFEHAHAMETQGDVELVPASTTYGDPSGQEGLTATQPLRSGIKGKGQWGKPQFGKVWHTPRNFAYQTSTYWSKKFRMKRHRYTKRWRKRRYKLASLANLPFAKKLRVNMIPKLAQGKRSDAASSDLDDFSLEAQDLAAAAVQGKTKSATKKRYRPKSKYQV